MPAFCFRKALLVKWVYGMVESGYCNWPIRRRGYA